jgi:OFA family oxalate/formate antiporter-like MFS transporter
MLAWPKPGYAPPGPPDTKGATKSVEADDWSPGEMMKTWQFYVLLILFIGSTQSGLMVIANATPILAKATKGSPFLVANAWILPSFGGLINALGRIGTGKYSDVIGRNNAYTLNCLVSALSLFLLPAIIASGNILLLFISVGIAYWQYGGGLALLPAYTADFYGTKNLGMNFGLVFLGWGCGFFMTRLAGTIKDITGSLTWAYFLSAIILIFAVIVSRVAKAPVKTYRNSYQKKA